MTYPAGGDGVRRLESVTTRSEPAALHLLRRSARVVLPGQQRLSEGSSEGADERLSRGYTSSTTRRMIVQSDSRLVTLWFVFGQITQEHDRRQELIIALSLEK